MDLHHNLFYGYRGPNTEGADRDRQLENNVTKALINTLCLGGQTVWRPFLAELGLTEEVSKSLFLMQRCDLPAGPAANRRNRVLLGISKRKSDWSLGGRAEWSSDSLPDAWIYGDGFVILIESKVNDGDFSPGQMQAHLARLWSSNETPPDVVLKTWRDLHSFFHKLLPSLKGAEHLLVEQFVQFLEYSGMSKTFTGFRREHFEYFLLHDDEDARRWVRDQMTDFADQVLARLHEFDPFYAGCDVGVLRLSDAYCWAAFGPRKSYRDVTHQTISLGSDGLCVFVNTELKSATDRLKTVVSRCGDNLRAALQKMHRYEPFNLVLEKRTQRQASLYDYTPQMRLHSSMLADAATSDVAWMAFTRTVQQLPLPYMRIERLVLPSRLIKPTGTDAVQKVVEILQRNHAVVKLLNDPPGPLLESGIRILG